jgi:hypothetical protein
MNIAEIAKEALKSKIEKYKFKVASQEFWSVDLVKDNIVINFSIQEPRYRDWLNIAIKKGDKKYELAFIRLAKKKEGYSFIETSNKLKKDTPPFDESDYYLMLQDSFENLEVNYPEIFTGDFPWERNYKEY